MKSFIKSFSIYGMIPIFGKFIGILLLPLYARALSPDDYGAQDILIQITIFITFLINLEMYGGVGRYFYEKTDFTDKRKLVSTGLWLTVLFAIVIVGLALVIKRTLYGLFFATGSYVGAFNLTLVWAPISSLYTYLLVLMRYEKNPKLYFLVVNIQLLIRIFATIVCVLFLKLGVFGVVLGHVIAETSSIMMFGAVLRKYIGLKFDFHDFKLIALFSLPMVPAVLIISFQKPLIRYLVANLLSVTDMGFYSIALQIAAILSFVQFGLRMAWYPHLFELVSKPGYESEVKKIYNFFLGIVSFVAVLIILNGGLLLRILTTPAYYPAKSIIGFIVIYEVLEIVRQISGCGPAIVKKTIYTSYYELAASFAAVLGFLVLHKYIGIIGLSVSFILGSLIKFVWSWKLTQRFTEIKFSMRPTYAITVFLTIISIAYAMYNISHLVSLLLSIILLATVVIIYRTQLVNVSRYSFLKLSQLKKEVG